ncbi:HEAT repeat protein [Pirellulimonas nuda]|uniref:HEAT repeat protein n=1 Tax=Pirellulimonas nuda TaxID=2528009 RepID=A0A518DJX5_9BACT|nr:HEAT repeat domain-containing protein [Pirellulimonas nuda]QDU91778.1 HEAT repeat protein [Pirellulimonas nuda]
MLLARWCVLVCLLWTPVAAWGQLSPTDAQRYAEVDALASSDTPLAGDTLVELSRSDNAQLRWRAARAIGLRGAPTKPESEALVTLLADKDPVVQSHAAIALARIGEASPEAIDLLVAQAASPDQRVAVNAIRVLRSLAVPPERLVEAIEKVLESDNESAMAFVVEAVVESGAKATPLLIEALGRDRAAYWAAVAIAQIGPDAADTTAALAKVVAESADPLNVKQALVALAEIGPAAVAAAPAIEARAQRATENPVRIAAAYALGSLGDSSASGWLRTAVKDPSPMLSMVSSWALARLHPDDPDAMQRAVSVLVRRLSSPISTVRLTAATGLKSLDAPPQMVRDAIMQQLASSPAAPREGDVQPGRELMAEALASLGADATPAATRALGEPHLRALAIDVLGRLGPEAAAAATELAPLAASEDAGEAVRAQFALAAIGPAAGEATLDIVANLASDDQDVRESALFALRSIGPAAAEAVPALLARIEKAEAFDRCAAAWALARIAPRDAKVLRAVRPVFEEALGSKELGCRIQTLLAIRDLGPAGAAYAERVAELAKADPSEEVRSLAREQIKP